MTSIRRFTCSDLLTFNAVNLDPLTETYNFEFYLNYLARWPEYCNMAVGPNQTNMGYILGKVEGDARLWHGHVTAVTVASDCRRLGLASKLMGMLEDTTEKMHNGYFVDLFVRKSNDIALKMYHGMGYSVYREVIGYYSGNENALDMRKAMARDVHQESVRPLPRPIRPEELEFD